MIILLVADLLPLLYLRMYWGMSCRLHIGIVNKWNEKKWNPYSLIYIYIPERNSQILLKTLELYRYCTPRFACQGEVGLPGIPGIEGRKGEKGDRGRRGRKVRQGKENPGREGKLYSGPGVIGKF